MVDPTAPRSAREVLAEAVGDDWMARNCIRSGHPTSVHASVALAAMETYRTEGMAELRALSEAATQGEWRVHPRTATTWPIYASPPIAGNRLIRVAHVTIKGGNPAEEDARFAAACVNYVRAALAQLEPVRGDSQ